MKPPGVLSPLRYRNFRLLWLGMGASYAGDRLQELAQGWLVATLTGSSALAVGAIGVIASIPQLLMPVGGAIADQLDRRKLLIATQLAGALAAGVVGISVVAETVTPWQIYTWAFVSGTIWLLARPSYKVVLTESVPRPEVRAAVSINSMTETALILLVASGGSLLLDRVGLALGFAFNCLTYLVAAACLWAAPELGRSQPASHSFGEFLHRLPFDLWEGFVYLFKRPALILPIALTFATVALVMPMTGLLAAVVHAQGGSIISLGLLGAANGLGALFGALYAGWRGEGRNPVRLYGLFGLLSAAALAFFAATPVGWLSALPLAVVGFALFSQAVWNTSRVRLEADTLYQARLQSLTTMAFTMAGAIGMAWGGLAIDRFGMPSLRVAAGLLGLICLAALFYRPAAALEPGSDNRSTV